MRSRFLRGLTVLAGVLSLAGPVQAQVTNFSQDVATAIDRSLNFMAAAPQNGFTGGYGDATGLAVLAALEKRADADQNSLSLGYAGANATDKARIDSGIAYMIGRQGLAFYSYRNGQELMAFSIYLRTGGPNQAGAKAALDAAFDEGMAHVPGALSTPPNVAAWGGFFNYNNATGTDASTNQFMMSGLAAARSIYGPGGYAPDAVRFARLEAVTARSAQRYLEVAAGDGLSASERGIGYNIVNRSLQQTASGAWILQVGGHTLNHAGVQGFLEWIRNRYAYTTNNGANGTWGTRSYGYYLWSAAKAFTFLEDSGVVPCTGVGVPDVSCTGPSLTTADMGLLPPASAPGFAAREVRRDPATAVRPAVFGPGGAGYYNDPNEPGRWYFDFAYTIISRQNANGGFSYLGPWNAGAEQAYYTLVLTRSVGGGCLDTDADGVCDADDNCPSAVNDNQVDADGDGPGDACDACPNDAANDADGDGACGDVDNCLALANADQTDTDGDGLGDACDACPNDAANDADGDGVCGDADNCAAVANADQADADGDGVGDVCDNCVSTPNPDQADANGNGIGDACDNQPPVAADDAIETSEDAGVSFGVLGNDTDPDGNLDPASLVVNAGPVHGALVPSGGGNFTYTPAPNYNGPDSFSYTVCDLVGVCDTATVSITVTPVNDPPVANPDAKVTPEETPVSGQLTSSDVDGGAPVYSLATGASHGGVVVNLDGSYTYTPAANYNGPDSFTYTVADGNGGTATATVSITVTPVNDPPVANPDAKVTPEETPVNGQLTSSDVDGGAPTYSVATGASHGDVVVNPDGSYTYTPASNYNGPDSFTYTVADGNGGSATATVSITVTPVNDAPVANPDAKVTPEDTLVGGQVTSSDVDGGDPVYSVVTGVAHGTLVFDPNGSYTYMPALNYNGPDSFTYLVDDGAGGTSTATVSIVVTPVNDQPFCTVAPSVNSLWPPNHQLVPITLSGATDVDGNPLTYTVTGIFQDEPTNTTGDGNTAIDGFGVGTSVATVRAERTGVPQNPGDGRVYHIGYSVSDGDGGICSGEVLVGVPHDQSPQRRNAVDGGALYDSTVAGPAPAASNSKKK